MATITIIPLPEIGHILPTLALTQKLIVAGHWVEYITAPQFTGVVEAVGGKLLPLFPQEKDAAPLSSGHLWYKHILNSGLDSGTSRLKHLINAALQGNAGGLVLGDVKLGDTLIRYLYKKFGPDRFMGISTALPNWLKRDVSLPGLQTIVFCPEALEIPRFRTQGPELIYAEPSLSPLQLEGDQVSMNSTAPVVVVTALGTQGERYPAAGRILSMLYQIATSNKGWQFVVGTGGAVLEPGAGNHIEIPNLSVSKWIPQRTLLQQASVLITHGGLGSLKEALYAGRPSIVIPMIHDQPYNAMRVRYHGLGEAIFPTDIKPRTIQGALERVLTGQYAEQVATMQRMFVVSERNPIALHYLEQRCSGIRPKL